MTFEKEFPSLKRCQYTGEEIKVANNTICNVIFYPQLIIKNSCIDKQRVKNCFKTVKQELNNHWKGCSFENILKDIEDELGLK